MPTHTPSRINLLDNPKFKHFIDAFTSLSEGSEQLSLDEVRNRCKQFFLTPDTIYEPVKQIEDVEVIAKDQHKIPVRIYTPNANQKSLPVMMFFHRGGWVFGSVEEADPVCRKLANHIGCVVASVDYRRAPEHPFPKPVEDCYDATQWVAKNAARFGGDPKNVIVCGESAGGNMATVVALMTRDRKGAPLSKQLLICPVISSTCDEKVYANSVDKYFITLDSMKFFWNMYLQSAGDQTNPYASPDKGTDLSGLPPAVIITAEYDPLRIEAEDYGRKLDKAGVKVTTKCFPGVIHSFIDLPIYEENQMVSWIKEIGNCLK